MSFQCLLCRWIRKHNTKTYCLRESQLFQLPLWKWPWDPHERILSSKHAGNERNRDSSLVHYVLQDLSKVLKLVVAVWEAVRCSYSCKLSPHDLSKQKEKNTSFSGEKPSRRLLNRVPATKLTSSETPCVPPRVQWGHITFVLCLPQMHNLNLFMRKQKPDPHRRTFYRTLG